MQSSRVQRSKTSKVIWILGVIGLILSILVFLFLRQIDFFKSNEPLNDQKCTHVFNLPLACQDLEIYNSQFLIGDLTDLYGAFHDLQTSKDGGLIALNLNDINSGYQQLSIKNFPSGVRLQPHGIYLKQNTLFMVNHGMNKGKERIERVVLNLKDNNLQVQYETSYIFQDPEKNGIFNDIVVVGDCMYLTQYSKPLPPAGFDHTFMSMIREIGDTENKGNIWKCKIPFIQSECQIVVSGFIKAANGITTDGESRIWVADMTGKIIYEFKIIENGDLERVETIPTKMLHDNLKYDPFSGNVYAASINRAADMFYFFISETLKKNSDAFILGTGLELEYGKDKKFKQLNEVVKSKKISGVSVVTRWEKEDQQFYFLGSFYDPKLVVCQLT